MVALKLLGATSIRVVHRCTSGDVTGDRKSVVGYLSAVARR
jgi:AmmeMemoRadiSam system protein B